MIFDQRGQVTILVLGLSMVAFAVAGIAVDGTRAFLMRRTLQNAADASALAGAGELDVDAYYASGGRRLVLDPLAAKQMATTLLEQRDLVVVPTIAADQERVAVVLRTKVDTMFLRLIGIDNLAVAAQADARPLAGQPP
jgi:Flp pilus assembly protein TadG